ncbi:MAG: DUF3592 domain-containing protein [Alphaproteobacteria bacterium]
MILYRALFTLSLLLLLSVAGVTFQRVAFLSDARVTQGTVTRIVTKDASCGFIKTSPCKAFEAQVEFTPTETGMPVKLGIPAGDAGEGKTIDSATHKPGQAVKVVYDRTAPATAYEYSFWGIWNAPAKLLVYQLITLWACLGGRPQARDYSFGF